MLSDTIIALSTPQGEGAIGLIRLSGMNAVNIVDPFFFGKNLHNVDGNTLHYGKIKNEQDEIIDECVISFFKGPRSYTKEDVIEISCHGSAFIIQSIIQLFIRNGARMAEPGEFTMKAYLNGQMDLTQAEAISDLIASKTKKQHEIALHQMRGGFKKMIQGLRSSLIEFASLIELENDFGEEDVEFANREQLVELTQNILKQIKKLKSSFEYGNAIKEGISVAIVGKPNVGKSTLLNVLLNEERAIVSDIAGTTRDTIEETCQIGGLLFRFVDTAGIRDTAEIIESKGIERSKEQIKKSKIVIYMDEVHEDSNAIAQGFLDLNIPKDQKSLIVLNKMDLFDHTCHSYDIEESVSTLCHRTPTLLISADQGKNIDTLQEKLVDLVTQFSLDDSEVIVSNVRHVDALTKTQESLDSVITGIENSMPSDLVALDIRHALHSLGTISGEISTDDLLDSIFHNFCIGK